MLAPIFNVPVLSPNRKDSGSRIGYLQLLVEHYQHISKPVKVDL